MIKAIQSQLPDLQLTSILQAMTITESYEAKLRALLEGLGTKHLELLMSEATTEDYRTYGRGYASRVMPPPAESDPLPAKP